MADSFLGDIAGMLGGRDHTEIAEALKGLPDHVGQLLAQPTDALGHMGDDPPLSPLVEAFQVDVATAGGDAATVAVEATAESAVFALPAGADWSELQSHLEGMAEKLQTLESVGQAKMTSADPNEQAHGQLLMQQSQTLMEQVQSTLQQMHDATLDVVQNLHADADVHHDGQDTVVAVADSGDGHAVAHQDASVDHPVDHASAAPAHDDGATAGDTTA